MIILKIGQNEKLSFECAFLCVANCYTRKKLLKIRRYFLIHNRTWKVKLSYHASLSIDDGSVFRNYTYKEEDLDQATAYFG